MNRHLLSALLVCCAVLPARAAEHIALDVHFSGLDAFASTPKDAYLRAALKALGPRLAQLPSEVGEDPDQGVFASALWEPMRGQTRARLTLNDDDPRNPQVRLYVEVRPVEPERAADIARAIALGAEQDGHEIANAGGLRTFTSEKGDRIAFGVRAGALVLTVNNAPPPDQPAGRIEHAPADAPLLLRAHIHGPTLSRIIDLAPSADTQEDRQGKALLAAMGLYGPSAITFDAAMWRGGRGLEGALICRGARPHWAPFAADTLGEAFLANIPADATWCSAGACDFAAVLDALIRITRPDDPEAAYAEARDFLGFDLRTDLLAHIGPRFAWYQSERTGGGGLMSTVAIGELRDPPAFAATHTKIVRRINELGAGLARGYIRIDEFEHAGVPAHTLRTPGLPLPIGITWAWKNTIVVKGLSPIAFAEALAFAGSGEPGIATNTAIRQRAGDPATLASLSYTDTQRKARTAVGSMTAMLLMIGNAARINPAAAGAPPLPTAEQLLSSIHPSVTWSRWNGDDMLVRWTCDDSLTVAGGLILAEYASIGSLRSAPLMLGILLPAIERARAEARTEMEHRGDRFSSPVDAEHLPRVANLQAINLAIVMHCAQSGDVYPTSLDALLEEGLVDRASLRSPHGPSVFPGGADYVMHLPAQSPAGIDVPAQTIILVDVAAMGSDAPTIPVCTADGVVHLLTPEELDATLALPHNAGMKTALLLD